MKKLILLAAVLGVAALPAVASGDTYPDVVSIHSDSEFFAEEIFGSVESPKAKCERNRTIKLFHDDFDIKRRGNGFQQVDQTTTDQFGEYKFFGQDKEMKRGGAIFDEGEYFARVTKQKKGGDTCRRDDSRVIEVFTFCQAPNDKQTAAAASRRGVC